MLRVYICSKCYNYRLVSRKPDAVCFHCGSRLVKCDFEYVDYANMSEEDRDVYREKYRKRMQAYINGVDQMKQRKKKES